MTLTPAPCLSGSSCRFFASPRRIRSGRRGTAPLSTGKFTAARLSQDRVLPRLPVGATSRLNIIPRVSLAGNQSAKGLPANSAQFNGRSIYPGNSATFPSLLKENSAIMPQNTQARTSTNGNGSAPSALSLQSLAGAFIAIQAANKAICLQPKLPRVDITGLEDVNASLATAQDNANWWTKTVSANVQNQLQHIVDHSDLYSALAPDLDEMISHLKEATPDNPPARNLLDNISDELMTLRDKIQSILYGDGGTKDQPADDSVMGTYKQLTEYQQKVQEDETTFAGYMENAASDQEGIASQIKGLQDEISSLRTAISNDQAMIAGGAAAVATGIGLIVAGVALTPETGPGGLAVAALGVAAAAGGIAADTYGIIDMGKKQDQVSKDLVEIHDLHEESGARPPLTTLQVNLWIIPRPFTAPWALSSPIGSR